MKIIQWHPGMEPEAGNAYSGMSNSFYHSLKNWYGSSMLKHALRSVESFYYEAGQPMKHSIALERGQAFHTAIESLATLGNMSLFDEIVVESPTKTVTSKAWLLLKADNPEKAVLPVEEIEKVRTMAERLYRECKDHFNEGQAELSLFWIDETTGIQLKCRPDWLRITDGTWNLDYKTSKAHDLEGFAKEIFNYNYHLSAAMYMEGILQVLGITVEHYRFLVSANTPPYEVEDYELDKDSLIEGHACFRKCLTDIAAYVPDEKLKPKMIGLPRWGFKLT